MISMNSKHGPRTSALFKAKTLFLLWIAIALVAACLPGTTISYASLPKLDTIRVALFLDSGNHRQFTSYVTMDSAAGLSIASRTPEGIAEWFQIKKGAARFSPDTYRAILWEGPDLAAAHSLKDALDSKSFPTFVYSRTQAGKPVYEVGIGPYPSKEAANSAKGQASASSPVLAALNPAGMKVTGPLYLGAGTYASAPEARKQTEALLLQNIQAYMVYHLDAKGQLAYSVWVGGAADKEQLSVQQANVLKAVANLPLAPVDSNKPYIIERADVSSITSPGPGVPHYSFSASAEAGHKIWVSALDPAAGIQVQERTGRTYRGNIEISMYQNQMAVINELPFEQYLYSVVSAEMEKEFPLEALKAQAVSARTYALRQGMKYQVAHISDMTIDQAYKGMKAEFAAAVQAVDETKGEVLTDKSGLITPFYHSNAGGMTATSEEVWGQPISYLHTMPSPDDTAQKDKLPWHRIQFSDGTFGYIRSDFTKATGLRNKAGYPILEGVGTDVNVRAAPYVDNTGNPSIRKVNSGDRFVSIELVPESTSFSWIRGPYTATEMLSRMNDYLDKDVQGPLRTLEVTQRGASGRVTGLSANGQPIEMARVDNYRSLLGGVPSIRFDIEETGRYTVMGAGGAKTDYPTAVRSPLYVLAAGDAAPRELSGNEWAVLGGDGKTRVISRDPGFRISGQGFGHGLGMSQWGAKGLAEAGYGYQQILKYYYQGVSIVKD
jgi:stage II sporulation protein D